MLMLESASGKSLQNLSSARQTGDYHLSANKCLLLYFSFISGKKGGTWHLYRRPPGKASVRLFLRTCTLLLSVCLCVLLGWGFLGGAVSTRVSSV